jgi:hypothetical protein
VKFRAVILLSGKTATGMVVPPEVVESLGVGKRPPVRVSLGGHTYRSTVAVMGGDYMLPLSAENRQNRSDPPATHRKSSQYVESRPGAVESTKDELWEK